MTNPLFTVAFARVPARIAREADGTPANLNFDANVVAAVLLDAVAWRTCTRSPFTHPAPVRSENSCVIICGHLLGRLGKSTSTAAGRSGSWHSLPMISLGIRPRVGAVQCSALLTGGPGHENGLRSLLLHDQARPRKMRSLLVTVSAWRSSSPADPPARRWNGRPLRQRHLSQFNLSFELDDQIFVERARMADSESM